MATLRNLAAALLFTLIISSSCAEELEQDATGNETVVDFEKAFPNQLILATFKDVKTCDLDNEFKQQCTDEHDESFNSDNVTACLDLGCCYFDFSDVDDSVRCYKPLPVLGRIRTTQSGYYVIGNKPVQGQGFGYPSNTVPGRVPSGNGYYVTSRPTIQVQKPAVSVRRFRWRDYTFSFFKIGRTYDEALQECIKESSASMPSTLLEISNKLVSDYITSKIRSWENEIAQSSGCSECMGYWVGGNDRKTEGRWQWESLNDISLPGQGGYQNWYKSGSYQEPNGANGKDCLTIAATDRISSYRGTIGKWFDGDCNTRRYYICMKGTSVKSSVFNTGTVICPPGTCLNGGQCFPFSPTGGYECRCNNGFSGDRCEIPPSRPTIPPTQVVPTTSCCAVQSYLRKPCGYTGIPGNLCRNRLGCCYNDVTRSCFHRALGCQGPARTTTTVKPTTTPTVTPARFAYWLKWSGWSKCSRSCGQGRWTRIRGCMGGIPGKAGCLGESTQSVGCNIRPCPVQTWTAWGQWSTCSVSCGSGSSFRVRQCQVEGKPSSSCPGAPRDIRNCGQPCATWSRWGSWEKCSVTCGNGFRSRSRICIGNGQCPGEAKQEDSCTLPACPIGTWSSWTVIQQCGVTCGTGKTVELRICRGSGCPGSTRRVSDCNTQPCIGWANWGRYGACTRTCGRGTTSRTRSCNGGRPGQPGCAGDATMVIPCNTVPCSNWTPWSNVGKCSVTCNGGTVRRTRVCLDGKCTGSSTSTIACATVPCSYWSAWSEYGVCSVTCGIGVRVRTRECQGGISGDKGCQGVNQQTIRCTAPSPVCVTATWGQWTEAGECSAKCGVGQLRRVRTCIGGVAGQTGCKGPEIDFISCNLSPCGSWKEWGSWSRCSTSCGSGTRFRLRTCSGGTAGSPGCPGTGFQNKQCNQFPCPDVVLWTRWSEWSSCSASCDSGISSRFRTCQRSTGEISTGKCPGNPTMTKQCRAAVACRRDTWSQWTITACSVSCGTGLARKTRTCIQGTPGVGNCQGKAQETQPCIANRRTCVVPEWAEWGVWTSCSVTCGKGRYSRSRICKNGNVGGNGCSPATDAVEMKECMASVPTCSRYGEWSEYSKCSQTCGGGRQTRTRICIGGNDCVGESSQTITCNNQECATWGSWESWSQCSKDCGTGVAKRVRKCIGGVVGAPGCIGRSAEEKSCNTQSCPTWSSWSDYSECTVDCGGGKTTRNRTCLNGDIGQTGCEGASADTRDCNTSPCDTWGEWNSWSGCSADCGSGISIRSRTCLFGIAGVGRCQGVSEQRQVCNQDPCASWGPWTSGECSVTCGEGIRTMRRECIGGIAGISEGCLGESTMDEDCDAGVCEYWGEWESWSACSATCGGGEMRRMRNCINGHSGENRCLGPDEETKLCGARICETWSEWGLWSECSATCGGGESQRERECMHGVVGSALCQGDKTETRNCGIEACAAWSVWQTWKECSVTCGGGLSTRNRICIGAEGDETGCEGADEETRTCGEKVCEFWSEWQSWSDCSRTCGIGVTERLRVCISGDAGDIGCMGPSREEDRCNTQPCAIWSDWRAWGDCSVTCGGGVSRRRRLCTGQNVGEIGCEGPDEETQVCGEKLCEFWAEWQSWSACSQTCGNGMTARSRVCISGVAGDIGCTGPSREEDRCNTEACATWGEWQTWNECSVTCGGGVSTRNRVCIGGNSNEIGCEGPNEEAQICGEKLCEFWAEWQSWSGCSKTCGNGVVKRLRVCTYGEAGDNGCTGPFREEDRCNTESCVTCEEWAEWSACSVTCGGGTSTRTRSCDGCDPETDDCREEDLNACATTVCPEWSLWEQWSACSATCGGGLYNRNRTCVKEGPDSGECIGESNEIELCNEQICPEWTMWGAWTECTQSCSGGTRLRERTCNGTVDGSNGCDGPSLETELCNSMFCPIWSFWGEWSSCNATCGEGSQVRVRTCIGGMDEEDCVGDSMETQICSLQDCNRWTDWGNWSDCSVTCGVGISRRTRSCEPESSSVDCIGDNFEERECSDKLCAAWSEWGIWSDCSTSCGGGENIRFRICIGGDAGFDCAGDAVESTLCNNEPCPQWTSWGDWSDCSTTCGPGSAMRNRICRNGIAGLECPGVSFQTDVCLVKSCADWNVWETWSDCSKTCGNGVKLRFRGCTSGEIGEGECTGPSTEEISCNTEECPTWGEWSSWSACSATCGDGEITRRRVCINGEPGLECLGESIERNNCTLEACSFWTAWQEWSSCSATCGGGERKRERVCIDGSPGDAGCEGAEEEMEMCGGSSAEDCPTWSSWSVWSSCNAKCGGGIKTRTRICINPNLDGACGEGDYTEETTCNLEPCASWASWTSWTTCSTTCGEGQSQRTRECINGLAGEDGCEFIDGIGDLEQELCVQRACSSWNEWSLWSTCTKTCDGGVKERTRECLNGSVGDPGCEATNNLGDFQLESCEEQLCPQFSEWTQWSACNASCDGQGVRSHTRVCLNGEIGQFGCEGPVSEDQSCTGPKCAFWSTWSEYSECTRSCGGGVQTRGRLCVGGQVGQPGCLGPDSEEMACNEQTCTMWSLWGRWSSCLQTCGESDRVRFRICMNGQMGDPGCEDGSSMETEACLPIACPSCKPDWEEIAMMNGNVTCTNGSEVGSVCSFQCIDGFEQFGDVSLTCESNIQWSNFPPSCLGRCSDVADIVFIIDSSSSIGVDNFEIVRNFLKTVARRFTIGPDAAQFGAIRYNKNVYHLWDLKDYSTITDLTDAIDAIPYDGTGTHTGQAIVYAHNRTFTAAAGRRVGVPKIAVVITDGVSFDEVSGPASIMKSDGAFVVAVGIGKAKEEQINEIASDPNDEFSTIVDSFDDLPGAVSAITDQIKLCKAPRLSMRSEGCPPQVIADILLIVDRSSSIGSRNFNVMKDFIKDLISDFNVGLDATMFGIILYNREVSSYFQLDDFEETTALLAAIDRMPYSGMGTRTGMALEFAATSGFSVGREGIPKIAVVITDGKSQDEVTAGAKALKEKAEVIAIGIEGAVFGELIEIASDQSDVFTTDFEQLADTLNDVKSAICDAEKKSSSNR